MGTVSPQKTTSQVKMGVLEWNFFNNNNDLAEVFKVRILIVFRKQKLIEAS
jgi:hypothetical protein